ncbi:nitroreductase family protein [Duganella sp. CF517]|uniref:nitroreductase family protein n=1 Tax=Duganella sp. CF517 TaxID=1881038 RepID=UPI0021008AE4|nr:nitroreductase family protein [Duganella sp. CF517]
MLEGGRRRLPWRLFLQMSVTDQVIECLLEAARWAASADNMQPWRFRWDGATLRLLFIDDGKEGAFGIDSPATLLAFGGVIENVTRMAEATGCQLYEAVIFPAGDDKNCVFRCRIDAAAPGAPRADWRTHPLFSRHTNRLPYADRALPDELVGELAALAQGEARCRLLVDAPSVQRWAGLVREGSSLRFRNRLAHIALDASLRMTEAEAARGDGLDVATFFLPPGAKSMLSYTRSWPRMAMLNRIGLYKLFASIEADLVRKGPGLVLVTGAAGRQGALDAGQLLVRAWTRLNQAGLAVQPYYVVPDQIFRLKDGTVPEEARAEALALERASQAALPAGATLYMVLRVGYPKKPAVRSRRLTLSEVAAADA